MRYIEIENSSGEAILLTFTPAAQIPISVRRKAASVHEAGHALVGIVLGRKVSGAILRQPHGLSGETQFEDEPDQLLDLNIPANRHTIEDAVVVLLAGKIAEAEHWKRLSTLYSPDVDTHRDDFADIERLVSGFVFNEKEKLDYMAHCTNRAEKLILAEASTAAIAEISQRLFDTFCITRDELDEILVTFKVAQKQA